MKSQDDVILTDPQGAHKPRGLLDAISEIQQYYTVEKGGSNIPEDFLTIKGKLSFFMVGFKHTLLSGFVSLVFTPISIGVINNYIPIFGSRDPSLFDEFFALMIGLSFNLGYSAVIAILRKYNIGSITRTAIRSLLGGILVAMGVKVVFSWTLYHLLYFLAFEPHVLSRSLLKIPFVTGGFRVQMFHFLLQFRPVLLTSAYFIAITSVLFVGIPAIFIYKGGKRLEEEMRKKREWE